MLTRFSLSVVLLAMNLMAVVQAQGVGLRPDQISIALLERLHYFQAFTPKRQSNTTVSLSEFPIQCQPGCKTAVNALNTCSAATCLCNAPVESSLSFCVNCSVNTIPSASVIQSGQQVVDTYNTLCKGTNVSSISLNITAPIMTTSTPSVGGATSAGFGSGSAPTTANGPTTTITVPLPTGGTAATGASTAQSTSGSSASTTIVTRASVGYAFIALIIPLLLPDIFSS
ncbi:hypothetical protein F5887DRAFT_961056 [Amanita rubescens]|nr:hypothetical protein F5887DRAFT_961056 [Amanita rubescens]